MKRLIFMIFLNLEFIKCTQFSMKTEAIETRANRVITRTVLCGILEKLTDPKSQMTKEKHFLANVQLIIHLLTNSEKCVAIP